MTVAQNIFPDSVPISNGVAQAERVASGDFTGDGIFDLLVMDRTYRQISLVPGVGDGTFGFQELLPFNFGFLRDLRGGDLDQDGDFDFAAATGVGNQTEFYWFRSDGAGSFSREIIGQLNGSISEFSLADLDGDGDLDVVAEMSFAQPLATFFNNGNGFTATQLTLGSLDAENVRVHDWNRDGMADVSFRDRSTDILMLTTALGSGTFSMPREWLPTFADQVVAADFGDLDGDGDEDIVVLTTATPPQVHLVEALGTGTYAPPVSIDVPTHYEGLEDIAIDVDGDGLLDLLLVEDQYDSRVGQYSAWMRNLGGMTFAAPLPISSARFATALADVTGDGRLDELSEPSDDRRLYLAAGLNPNGTTWLNDPEPIRPSHGIAYRFAAVDADRDGDKDILALTADRGLTWMENSGGGRFADVQTLSVGDGASEIIGEADFDGDGFVDLLTTGWPIAAVAVKRSVGPGQYADAVPIGCQPGQAVYIVVADGDLDGDPDIFLQTPTFLGFGADFVQNIGPGTSFACSRVVYPAANADCIWFVDVNGDSLLDVIASKTGLAWYHLNLGGGAFAAAINFQTTGPIPNTGATSLLDIDQDGDDDLVAKQSGGGSSFMLWAENRSPSPPAPFTPVPFASQLEDSVLRLQIEDLNRDGRGDLIETISTGLASSRTRVHPGLPSGGYGPPELLGENYRTREAQGFEDLDGDGDLDTWTSSGWISYFHENATTASVGNAAPACAVGALNSTGRPGEIVAYGSASVTSTDLRLNAVRLPPDEFGFFVGARAVGSPIPVAMAQGSICLRGSIGRYNGPGALQSSGPAGTFWLALDPQSLLIGPGAVAALTNETWSFQAWHRDVDALGAATSNFTNALSVVFVM